MILEGGKPQKIFQKFPVESTFINAETRGLTHRIIWCRIWGDEKTIKIDLQKR